MSVRESEAKLLLRNLGIKFIDLQTIYFIDGQNIFVRSRAIFGICSYLSYPWKLLLVFKYLPVNTADFFYKLFAKFRYFFN